MVLLWGRKMFPGLNQFTAPLKVPFLAQNCLFSLQSSLSFKRERGAPSLFPLTNLGFCPSTYLASSRHFFFLFSVMFDLVSSFSHLISIQDCYLTDREIGQQTTCSYFYHNPTDNLLRRAPRLLQFFFIKLFLHF